MSGQVYSWMNPALEIRETRRYGNGVFARSPLKKDDTLFVMGGYILTIDDENHLTGAVADKPIEISDRFSIGPRSPSDIPLMPQHYVNHSCEPNAGFNGQIFMVAMRNIGEGEEITYDYAMVMCSNAESNSYFTMQCLCGRASCRSVIAEDDWKRPELQDRYNGYFQWWLQRKIDQQSSASDPPPRQPEEARLARNSHSRNRTDIYSQPFVSPVVATTAHNMARWYWTHPALYARQTTSRGKGIYSSTVIPAGETLIVAGGAVIPAIDEDGDHGIQISETLVLATPRECPADLADYLNHSCDPNAGFQGQIILVAMRDIRSGEEVTFDYAMCLHPGPGLAPYEMPCACGSGRCRQLITDDDWELPILQKRYDGYFQLYIQRKIDRRNRQQACPSSN